MKLLTLFLFFIYKNTFSFIENPISTDARIRTLIYREDSIYSIIFSVNINTKIKFVKGEKIKSIMIGDRSNWELKVMDDNILYIRPIYQNLKTNMIIDTDKRSYIIDIKSEEDNEEIIYFCQFIDPSDPKSFTRKEKNLEQEVKINEFLKLNKTKNLKENKIIANEMSNKNFKYSFNGEKELAPNLIFDDGIQTFFKFSNNITPVIYQVNENGEEILINLRLNNGYLVFNGIKKQFSIRSGGKLACIFNEK